MKSRRSPRVRRWPFALWTVERCFHCLGIDPTVSLACLLVLLLFLPFGVPSTARANAADSGAGAPSAAPRGGFVHDAGFVVVSRASRVDAGLEPVTSAEPQEPRDPPELPALGCSVRPAGPRALAAPLPAPSSFAALLVAALGVRRLRRRPVPAPGRPGRPCERSAPPPRRSP